MLWTTERGPQSWSVTGGSGVCQGAGAGHRGRGGHAEDVDLTQGSEEPLGNCREQLSARSFGGGTNRTPRLISEVFMTQLVTEEPGQKHPCSGPARGLSGPVAWLHSLGELRVGFAIAKNV